MPLLLTSKAMHDDIITRLYSHVHLISRDQMHLLSRASRSNFERIKVITVHPCRHAVVNNPRIRPSRERCETAPADRAAAYAQYMRGWEKYSIPGGARLIQIDRIEFYRTLEPTCSWLTHV